MKNRLTRDNEVLVQRNAELQLALVEERQQYRKLSKAIQEISKCQCNSCNCD